MKTNICLLLLCLLGLCGPVKAGEVWIPERDMRQPLYPSRCESHGHTEWRSRVLRRYWITLPCGRRELWEDVEHYRVYVPPTPHFHDLDRWNLDTGFAPYR